MGECFISRRGGESYQLPVLDASYPQDVTIIASADATAVFSVLISEPGKPAEYTYQWYVNGVAKSGAISASYATDTTFIGTQSIYCAVTNKAGTVASRTAILTVKDPTPSYSYDGAKVLTKENAFNWNIAFNTSGTLEVSEDTTIEAFLVGGGGGGAAADRGGGGGGGGYTITSGSIELKAGESYPIIIGTGGSGGYWTSSTGWVYGGAGGTTSAFNLSAEGGKGAKGAWGVAGGSGGGAGAAREGGYGARGGSDGGKGDDSSAEYGGAGQGTTTRAFGESDGKLYAGGGGGGTDANSDGALGGEGGGGQGGGDGNYSGNGRAGTPNTGGGGGGGGGNAAGGRAGAGGSGIVIIRNAR